MERGFMKLWRKLKDSKCYSRGGVHRALLLTIFTEANWKAGHFRGEDVLPGQWATSVLGLSQELGFPRTTVQRALADLATDGVITVENMGNRWTRISLVNWQCYQPNLKEFGQPAGNQRATDGQQAGIIKEVKNTIPPTLSSLRSERDSPSGDTPPSKKKGSTIFRPPSLAEVEAYCAERRNAVDAGRFCDFYTSNGWKVGKNPMKDWKAAVRTWEREAGMKAEQEKPWTIPDWMQKGKEVRQ